ncbi:transposase [Streptomyces sp. MspMP-M5]|uniref:transposase n=1 Tax=Streptomyces sp. MspMP-M5 TaxID=1155718 RepID=UPI000997803A|nr:transposase [Streptomyces sp. SID8354]
MRKFIGDVRAVRAVRADRQLRPVPERLRAQCDGGIWWFRTGSQWREMPERFGAWQTVCDPSMRWRSTTTWCGGGAPASSKLCRKGRSPPAQDQGWAGLG